MGWGKDRAEGSFSGAGRRRAWGKEGLEGKSCPPPAMGVSIHHLYSMGERTSVVAFIEYTTLTSVCVCVCAHMHLRVSHLG